MKPGVKKRPDTVVTLDISIQYPVWEAHEQTLRPLINDAVHTTIAYSHYSEELADRETEISIVLCNDDFIQEMNREYRHKDKPTNVLSFPQTDFAGTLPVFDPLPLGDLLLAYQTITREAEKQAKSFEDHFVHLVVHGTLHLLGYDHEEEVEAEEMERLEIDILKQLGIKNPYAHANFVAE